MSKAMLAMMLVILTVAVSALGFRAPARPDPGRAASPLLKDAHIDRETRGIVERACQNCHSERTEWPWYSHIPPASWLLHSDVRQARERFNLSRWEGYSALEQQA